MPEFCQIWAVFSYRLFAGIIFTFEESICKSKKIFTNISNILPESRADNWWCNSFIIIIWIFCQYIGPTQRRDWGPKSTTEVPQHTWYTNFSKLMPYFCGILPYLFLFCNIMLWGISSEEPGADEVLTVVHYQKCCFNSMFEG